MLFADEFDLVQSFHDIHTTPWQTTQAFTTVVLRRRH